MSSNSASRAATNFSAGSCSITASKVDILYHRAQNVSRGSKLDLGLEAMDWCGDHTAQVARQTNARHRSAVARNGGAIGSKRGRPPTPEKPITVPLPFDELVSDILKAGPHPTDAKKHGQRVSKSKRR